MMISEFEETLFRALHEEIGLRIKTDETRKLRQRLYAARAKLSLEHPELQDLEFKILEDEVWVVKKTALQGAANDS